MSLLLRRLVTGQYAYVGSGGIVFGGSALLAREKVYTPSGGLVFGGAAGVARVRAWTPSGGIIFGGAALLARTRVWTPSGGIVFGGAAITTPPAGAVGGVGEGVGLFWHPDRRKRLTDDEVALIVLLAALGPYRRE